MMKNRLISFWVFIVLISVQFSANAQYSSDDWKWRNGWMQVEKLFELADVKQGDSVGDLGCHEGYLTMHLAQKVGEQGKVYAVDVRNDRLQTLKTNARKRKLKNITTILGDYDNPKLPRNSLDVIFVIDTYHEISAYKEVLGHLNNSLKSGAKLVLLEKLKTRLVGKSREDQVSGHTLSLNYVKKELQDTGFTIRIEIEDFGQWEEDPTKTMWVLIAEKL
jgi:ubiquinone/menaquinone biosynthesis C-methylase UbiE